jgi:KAP family P-loop domain
MTEVQRSSGLWLDEPTLIDLLAFDAVALTVAAAVLDDALDPVAIGVSGSWGSGKTTILRLVRAALAERNLGPDKQVLVVDTDPWRYDPSVGAKETLIGEVLAALEKEIREEAGAKGQARDLLKKLKGRVNWSKALQVAAKASLTLQLPGVDDLTKLINTDSGGSDGGEARGLEEFRTEFEKLMESKQLEHVKRVVVLVDDLDRCLYETVVGTLETIRLFLAVPRMSFVIAADDKNVADALRARFPAAPNGAAAGGNGESPEEAASLYLHKIVQTTVPLPALSRFDTEAYLVLLQLSHQLDKHGLRPYIDRCTTLRRESGLLDDLADAVPDRDISTEMTFASRLTPILYEKLRGNPRRIKRFLNDLRVRQSIAGHRGITLAPDIVAKLMVLEVLLDDGFKKVLDWLAKGELRDQMQALEIAAGRPAPVEGPADDAEAEADGGAETEQVASDTTPTFTDDLVRWAKLPPALGGEDLAPYLHLAASFTGQLLLDAGLPERLRDIAANLLSSVRAEQKSVTAADIMALTPVDAMELVQHLGRVARDRQAEQQVAVLGLLRITRAHPDTVDAAAKLLSAIPAAELRPSMILTFSSADKQAFKDVFVRWQSKAPSGPIKQALDVALAGPTS